MDTKKKISEAMIQQVDTICDFAVGIMENVKELATEKEDKKDDNEKEKEESK